MQNEFDELVEERDKLIRSNYCDEGVYTGENGEIVNGVCRTVPVEELFDFLHRHDAQVRPLLK